MDGLEEVEASDRRAYVDVLGRSTGLERSVFEAGEFVELACVGLGISIETIACARQDRETTRFRRLIATLGIERWGQRAGELGAVLGKHPDVVSRWARNGAERTSSDPKFAETIDHLDVFLAGAPPALRVGQ